MRIRLSTFVGDRLEIDPSAIVALEPPIDGGGTMVYWRSSCCRVRETMDEIRALEEAAKSPPNEADTVILRGEAARPDWRSTYPRPWKIHPWGEGSTIIMAANGSEVAQGVVIRPDKAEAWAHIVECVNNAEADKTAGVDEVA